MGVDLTNTNLCRADLSEANLSNPPSLTILLGNMDSILDHADLSGANLRNANLSNVSLKKANLSHSDLSDADLTKANLNGAIGITIEELEKQANSLKGATMPDKSIHE